jgi:quercetin dioxygenase-like cupin family protein
MGDVTEIAFFPFGASAGERQRYGFRNDEPRLGTRVLRMDITRNESQPSSAGPGRYATALVVCLSVASVAFGQTPRATPSEGASQMEISRNGSRPSAQGPPENVTGSVRIDRLFDARDPARASAALVTFEPGARSAWHSHPLGQRLIATSGLGWTQVEGGGVQEIRPGDVVWCPPNVKHWHGATPSTAMSHVAVQEALNGKVVEWMEKVTDERYLAGRAARSD